MSELITTDKREKLKQWRGIVTERITELSYIVDRFRNRRVESLNVIEYAQFEGAKATLQLNINLAMALMPVHKCSELNKESSV